MATMPMSPQGDDGPSQGGPSPAAPGVKLAMLAQLIQGLAQQFPQAQQGIKMMLDGLRQVQSSASSQSSGPPPSAPPR